MVWYGMLPFWIYCSWTYHASKWFLQSWHRRLGRRRRHSPLVPGSPWYSEFVSGLHWPSTSRLMGCWLLAGSPQYSAPQYCHCGYEDVKSSPTADGLVFFGVWHPSKQPSQVLDLTSWTCLSGFTSYYVVALVQWLWAAQQCHWPGAMCLLHW